LSNFSIILSLNAGGAYCSNSHICLSLWLDFKDIMIFDYIAQMCLSDNEKIKQSRMIINDTKYTHIAYKKIIKDNPLSLKS